MSQALAVVPAAPELRTDSKAFEPSTLSEGLELAKVLFAGKLLPKSIVTPEAAFTIIACGRELGMTAMQSLRSIHIIEGRPTLSADLAVALVKKLAACEFFRLVDSTADGAIYETKRRGEPEPTRMAFTAQDAEIAGLLGKDNWKKYRPAMLRARCSMALARAVYPDALLGVYDPDELEPSAPMPYAGTVRAVAPVEAKPGEETSADDDAQGALLVRFLDRFAKARSLQELSRVGVAIANATLNADRKAALKYEYSKRAAQLKNPTPPVPESGVEVADAVTGELIEEAGQ